MKGSKIRVMIIGWKRREKSSKPRLPRIPEYNCKSTNLRELDDLLKELEEEDYPMSIPSKWNPYVWVLVILCQYDEGKLGRSFREIYEYTKRVLDKYIKENYGGILNGIQPSVLRALEERGLIESYGKCRRKKYRLTEYGRRVARVLNEMIELKLI